jgi:segregation and condensation protein A
MDCPLLMGMADYRVQLDVFEGPLDLLLYLIKKEEVDIYEVNLTKIATQFIEYVEMMRRLDLDIAGEFLVMAATLMYIKSRELLPVEQQVTAVEDEEPLDPRWDLIRQLVEYKKFKDVAAQLQHQELLQENIYRRMPQEVEFASAAPPARGEVTLFDLLNAVSSILRRFQEDDETPVIAQDKWSVSEKIELLLKTLMERPLVKFSELFLAARSRSEVVATFLAMLELIRLKQIVVAQPEAFGEIEISKSTPPASAGGASNHVGASSDGPATAPGPIPAVTDPSS